MFVRGELNGNDVSNNRSSKIPIGIGTILVGRKVRVFWNKESAWFPGTISSYDAEKNEYEIQYPDGDITFESLEALIFVQDKDRLKEEGILDTSGRPNHPAYKKSQTHQVAYAKRTIHFVEPRFSTSSAKRRKFGSDEDKQEKVFNFPCFFSLL